MRALSDYVKIVEVRTVELCIRKKKMVMVTFFCFVFFKVGPRDGLQNEKTVLEASTEASFISKYI